MSHAIKVRANSSAASPILVADLGFSVPVWTGANLLVYTEDVAIAQLTQSESIFALTTDNAFPASGDLTTNSLILLDESDVLIPPGGEDAYTEPVFTGATALLDGNRGVVPQPLTGDVTPAVKVLGANGQWVGAGSGDVVGPAGATDGAVALYDTTTGRLLKDGPVPGAVNGLATLDAAGKVPTSQLPPDADADYAGKFETATVSITDIADGKWGWWWQTTTSRLYLVRNRADTLYYVEATTPLA